VDTFLAVGGVNSELWTAGGAAARATNLGASLQAAVVLSTAPEGGPTHLASVTVAVSVTPARASVFSLSPLAVTAAGLPSTAYGSAASHPPVKAAVTTQAVGQHLLVTFNTAAWPAFPAGATFALAVDTDDASAAANAKWLASSSCGVTAAGSARAIAGGGGAPESLSAGASMAFNGGGWLLAPPGVCHTIAVRGYQAPATVAAPAPAPRTGNGTLLDPDFGTAVVFEAHAWRAQRAAIVTPALNFSRPARAWIAAQLWSANRTTRVPVAPLTPVASTALAVDAAGVGVVLLPDIPLGGGGGGGPWLAPGQVYAVALWAGCAADASGAVAPGAASCVRLAHVRGTMPSVSRPAGAVGADVFIVHGASRQAAAAGGAMSWGELNATGVGEVAVWDAEGWRAAPWPSTRRTAPCSRRRPAPRAAARAGLYHPAPSPSFSPAARMPSRWAATPPRWATPRTPSAKCTPRR